MLLKKLSEACGAPGNEAEVRNVIREQIRGCVDSLTTDALGNLIAVKSANTKGPRVMIAAHMDEVALMIVGIEKDGQLKFTPAGGIDPRVLVAKSVVVGESKIPGVIGAKPIHLQKPDEREKPLGLSSLYIDIGVSKREEAEKLVSIGDYAYFTTKFAEVGSSHWKGKAFDDRVGCALLCELLKDTYSFPLYGAFTVQEEIGLRGAEVAAYAVHPDLALVLEGTTASDVVGIKEHRHATTLDGGPSLTFMDRSVIPDPKLVSRILAVAERHGIKTQYRRNTAGGTDAGKIRLSRGGVSTAVIALPCRYIHSPASIVSKRDFEETRKLVSALLKDIEESGV